MTEKLIKPLTEEEKIIRRVELEQMGLNLRGLEQTKMLMESDLKADIPNKRHRLAIRNNNVEIEKIKFDIKTIERMLRAGKKTQSK